jgi:hypothetical protein
VELGSPAVVARIKGLAWEVPQKSLGPAGAWNVYPPAAPWLPLGAQRPIDEGTAVVVGGESKLELDVAGGWRLILSEGEYVLEDARGPQTQAGPAPATDPPAWLAWRVRQGRAELRTRLGPRTIARGAVPPVWVDLVTRSQGRLRLKGPTPGAWAGLRTFADGSGQVWVRKGSSAEWWSGAGAPQPISPVWKLDFQGE